jgi:hypothetical protein
LNYAAMRYVAERCTVRGAGRAILWAMAHHADKDTGECWASNRRIADEAGVAHATVKRLLPKLMAAGELELVLRGAGRRSDCWRITACGVAMSPLDDPDPVDNPVDNLWTKSVVGSLGGRSGLIEDPVVGSLTGAPIGGRVKEEGLKGRARAGATPPADAGGAPRSGPGPREALDSLKASWRKPPRAYGPSPNGALPEPAERAPP